MCHINCSCVDDDGYDVPFVVNLYLKKKRCFQNEKWLFGSSDVHQCNNLY